MFRIPILFVLAGITSYMLYKNEQQRKPVDEYDAVGSDAPMLSANSGAPMLSKDILPQAPAFDDDDFSDSDASIGTLDLSRS